MFSATAYNILVKTLMAWWTRMNLDAAESNHETDGPSGGIAGDGYSPLRQDCFHDCLGHRTRAGVSNVRERLTIAAVALFVGVTGAAARPSPQLYDSIGVSPAPGAAVPRGLSVIDDGEHRQSIDRWLDAPTVLVLADYTCKTLCSPVLSMIAGALEKSGLTPGRQYKLLVIGLDPNDGLEEARKVRTAQLGDGELGKAALVAIASIETVRRVADALGYRYYFDRGEDQFIHPAAAFVLRPGGGVSRVLKGLGIYPEDVRLAIVEAGRGKVGTFTDRVRLLCSSFDPAHGVYNVAVSRMLWGLGALTIISLGGLIGILALGKRRRAA